MLTISLLRLRLKAQGSKKRLERLFRYIILIGTRDSDEVSIRNHVHARFFAVNPLVHSDCDRLILIVALGGSPIQHLRVFQRSGVYPYVNLLLALRERVRASVRRISRPLIM